MEIQWCQIGGRLVDLSGISYSGKISDKFTTRFKWFLRKAFVSLWKELQIKQKKNTYT